VQDLIALNCFPVAFISKYFLPILKKRTSETRKKCAIVNIASSAGMLTLPYFQVYGATKAFVDSFSKALSY
jgi:short-subunit dehydrogenase